VILHDNEPGDVHSEAHRGSGYRRAVTAQLQASEHDKFASHIYQSRREYPHVCERAGKSGKQIERCVISTFQVAESMGFKGEFRQWEHLLQVQD